MDTLSWADATARADVRAVREQAPFVYGLTNFVAAGLSANALLALGAGPAFGAAPGWARAFPAGAGAVFINGAAMMSGATPEDLLEAASTAATAGTPWVLDPVAVGAGAPAYDDVIASLLAHRPAIVRGNASEVAALAGRAGGASGVDSTLDSSAVVGLVAELAARLETVVAVSGATDYISDGTRTVAVAGGSEMMPRVTGTGCSLGGVCAALAAVTDPFAAAVAAHVAYAEAGERAGARTSGPGSFAVAFLDELAAL
ncbi:hydroxyethylthiazole kinase [Nocardioides sp. zg-DK7169]|uniref:hydroxyethylthiazole kinase n=1 Tax=Nocardioides sp. zg-DK7169 TaxID=2736600 RepID=UPI001556431F|nr:hydroxyethylthiazole kinase [Nocardioides sp. zg-DK7169]NPC96591.1 hydroxyethylthiazole kinase [Nocardioides sp. zg-DK7169]